MKSGRHCSSQVPTFDHFMAASCYWVFLSESEKAVPYAHTHWELHCRLCYEIKSTVQDDQYVGRHRGTWRKTPEEGCQLLKKSWGKLKHIILHTGVCVNYIYVVSIFPRTEAIIRSLCYLIASLFKWPSLFACEFRLGLERSPSYSW